MSSRITSFKLNNLGWTKISPGYMLHALSVKLHLDDVILYGTLDFEQPSDLEHSFYVSSEIEDLPFMSYSYLGTLGLRHVFEAWPDKEGEEWTLADKLRADLADIEEYESRIAGLRQSMALTAKEYREQAIEKGLEYVTPTYIRALEHGCEDLRL